MNQHDRPMTGTGYWHRRGRIITLDDPFAGTPELLFSGQEFEGIRETLSADPARLRCPRFAGDRDLAAVLAGRLRLAAPGTRPFPAPVRSKGPAVQKVQEVLIATGYPLPRFGADGLFGRETGAAVSRFKVDRRIEPSDPVVGPGTIRALDATCLPLPPPPAGCGSLGNVRVAVIGGGFAGLMAAWSLQSGGTRVTVFEAIGRLGGRVRTEKAFIPGKVVEAGAELIGTNHPTWISLARSFGLTLTEVSSKEDYKAKGLRVRLILGDTELSDKERKQLDRDLQPVLEQIGRDAKKVDALQPWKTPNAVALDAMSVAKRLDDNDMFGPASSVARQYFEFLIENDQCAPPSRQSYLGLLAAVRAHAIGGDMLGYWNLTETHRCAGGNEQLATHLAKGLRDVRLGTPVTSIDIKRESVRVQFTRKRAVSSEEFDYVVLATPPAVWPRINSSPPFRPQNYTIAHGPAVKFLSAFDRRFWEADKLAPSALWDRIGSVWESTDKQRFPTRGFGLTVYSGGKFVLDAATYENRMRTLYPKYGTSVRAKSFVNWPAEPWIRSGYAIPAPGQVTTISKNLSLPYLGRLFFAGEQASPGFFGYMEGALQSGVLAAYRVGAAVRTS